MSNNTNNLIELNDLDIQCANCRSLISILYDEEEVYFIYKQEKIIFKIKKGGVLLVKRHNCGSEKNYQLKALLKIYGPPKPI